MKKFSVILLVLVILIGSVYWILNRNKDNLPEGIAGINGRLTVDRIDVASLYAGRVEEVYVHEGAEVTKGQNLIRLSSSQVSSQISQAEAQKQQALDAVQRAQTQIDSAIQQLNIAKLDWQNAQRLHKENFISTTELQNRQAAYHSAEALVAGAKAGKAEAEATVKQVQAQMEQLTDRQSDMLIKSPLAGQVEYTLVDPGNVVASGSKTVSILDLDNVYMNIFLPAYQSNRVQIGDEARIIIDGIDAVLPAKVVYVSANAQFTPKSVETTEERTKLMFKIKLQIPKEISQQYKTLLKGGMTAMGYVKYDQSAQWPQSFAIKLPETTSN